MEEKLRITGIQAELTWENPDENRARLAALMSAAPASDLYVLPEMFTTGFTMNPEAHAEPFPGPSTGWMQEQAARFNAAIVGSISTRVDGQFFNRLIWVDASGRTEWYDKAHLFSLAGEEKHYSPGTRRAIIEYRGWKILPLICYDLRFPEWARNTWRETHCDYDLLLYVANWPDRRIDAWDALLRARAIENQAFVCGVNRVGVDGNGVMHSGHSAIYQPDGSPLSAAKPGEEGPFSGTLQANLLHAHRQRYSFLSDQRYSISQLGLRSTDESK